MADPKIVVARETFIARVNGREVLVKRGDTATSDSPIVKGREAMFDPFAVKWDSPSVEQATAGPGEKRTTRRAAA